VVGGDGGWHARHPGAAGACANAASAAYRYLQTAPAEVCVLLTNDDQMRALNAQFRRLDRPTNVLSFAAAADDIDAPPGRRLLGDIAIGLESVEREAAAEDKTVLHHLQHLTVHGMLHLLGYDHETDVEAEMMERLEVEILAALGVGDPYRDGDGDRT